MIRKEISILISAVFIVALMTSAPVSFVNVAVATGRNGENFLYSVSVSPSFARVHQGDFGAYDVQVLRGSDTGQFSVVLSLDAASSNIFKTAVTFNPPILNFEQGQTRANSTLKINSQALELGSTSFRVQATTRAPAAAIATDQALSNPAALIVRAAETSQSSNSQADSLRLQQPLSTSSSSQSLPAQAEQARTPEPKLNNLPIAEAGPDQAIKEGEQVILDGSASTDADKDALLLSWEQISPRNPSVKLVSSENSYKASFVSPDVDRDTMLRFKLVVKDSSDGISADSINVLVKNVEKQSPETSVPSPKQESPSSDSSTDVRPNQGETSTENHSPTAETVLVLLTEQDKPLSISLKGNDPDKDDKITFVILTNPSHGTVAGFDKTSGSLTYLPSSGYSGQDRLSFRVVDSHDSASNDGQVIIRVNAASQSAVSTASPIPSNLSSSTPEESSSSIPSSSTASSSPAPGSSTNANASSVERNGPKVNENTTAPFTPSTGTNTSAIPTNDTLLASANATLQNETLRSFAASSVAAGEVYRFVKDCSGSGTPFSSPHAVDVDSSGNLYVLDTGRNRVQVFDSDCTFIRQWGSPGAGNGQFNSPQGISVSPSGNIYVADSGNNRVQKFTLTGGFLLSWGGKGSGNGQFDTPVEIDHDSLGNSYVADANNKRIVKSLDGQFKAKWSGAGQGQGQMKGPHGIAVDSANFVYVTDNINNELLKFTNTGGHIKTVSGLNSPHGVTADTQNSIYLTERGANKVKKYDSDLNFLTEFGSGPGSTPGVFNGPDGITVSSSGKVYVTDSGNNKVQLWRPAPTISIVADTTQPKWDHEVKVTATAANFDSTDKAVFEWGDGTPSTEVSPIPQSGTFEVTHVYGIASLSTNPNNVVGKIQSSDGVELATSQPVAITVQKHATQLTLDLKPTEAPQCANCPIYVIGKLVDPDSVPPNQGVSGKTIALSGSGLSNLANPVQTGGVVFSGTSSANLTVNNGVLQMPVSSEISLPFGTHGVAFKFNGPVDVTFTKGNDQTVNFDDVASLDFDVAEGLKKITLNSAGELQTLSVRDFAVDGTDDHQIFVNFGSGGPPAGSYSNLEVGQGTYLSGGITQMDDSNGPLTIAAAFNAVSDPAYVGSTSPEISYDVSRAAGVGEGTATAYAGVGWTKLTVGGTNPDLDMCTSVIGGVETPSGDVDADGICDKFEAFPSGASDTTNNAFITCPSSLQGTPAVLTLQDPQCTSISGTTQVKYNLCFNDQFASAWSGNTDGKRVCPRPNHKDLYVEIDYMQGRQPDSEAIKRVIRSFGNAPFTGQGADAFGRTQGITLHAVVSDQFGRVAPFNVWQEATDDGNANNDFRHVKETIFGTAAERGGTSGMPGMTAAAWSSTGDTLKHYVYHYGQWISYYGGQCVDGSDTGSIVDGLSSGLAESLGNDFIVSLGCGFGGAVDPSGTLATKLGSLGTIDEQAGTFMHELGHNLNLGHGGAQTLAVTSINYNMNCKPNYFSVMNYARQMPNAVLDQTSWEAGFNYGTQSGPLTSLDYARSTSSPTDLSELSLIETTGVSSSDGKQYWILYGTPGKSPDVRKALTGTTFDFDGTGAIIATAVSVDLTSLSPTVGGCGPTSGQILKSYSDWDKINLVFSNDGDSQDGVTQRGSIPGINENTRELKPIFLEAIADNIQFEGVPPPALDGSTTFNTGQTVPLKFRIKDKDGNFITNAVVTLVAEKGSTKITGSTSFVFDPATNQYKYEWVTPKAAAGRGEWTLKYVINLATNPSVLIGPFATGPYTLKITGVS